MANALLYSQNQNRVVPGGGSCIQGSVNINVGQVVTFTSANVAQCLQCYDWDINGDPNSSDNSTAGNLKIQGSDMNRSVTIEGISVGTGSVTVTYFDETGCHTCTIAVNVVNPQNCNAPVLDGWFECRGSGPNTGGNLYINDNGVDWSKISSINIWLNGANFTGGYSGNTLTLTGPFTGPLIFSVIDSVQECFYGNDFGAIVTFNYNNGCPSVQTGGTWYDYNTPLQRADENKISVYPNPTSSSIQFSGKNLKDYYVTVYNTTGEVIVKKSVITNSIDLSRKPSGTYIYKIEDQSKVVQEGKITKK